QGQVYSRVSPDYEWQILQASKADEIEILDNLVESQVLNPELVDKLATADCTASDDWIRGEKTLLYSFGDVNLAGISNLQGLALNDMSGAKINSANLYIWLLPYNEIVVPFELKMDIEFEQEGVPLAMSLMLQIKDIDAPIEIEALQIVKAPSFAIALPSPRDANVFLERENGIGYFTSISPDEVHALYADYLAGEGWVEFDTFAMEAQDITFAVVEYSKVGQELSIAVGKYASNTVVSIEFRPAP
ncbi:MAG: hypothetical protein GY832_41600, partial [Chloroflexi bacterium]|nr:hypothetical protein [Chloroflexota bacterium]